jgi:hypothetical protein
MRDMILRRKKLKTLSIRNEQDKHINQNFVLSVFLRSKISISHAY